MKKLGDSSYLEDFVNMDNLVNEYNRTYRDAMEEKGTWKQYTPENVKSSVPFPDSIENKIINIVCYHMMYCISQSNQLASVISF